FFADLITRILAFRRKAPLKIDTARYHLYWFTIYFLSVWLDGRGIDFGSLVLRKYYLPRFFRQNHKPVRFAHQPFLDPLCHPIQQAILFPDACIGVFLRQKAADIKDQFWLPGRKFSGNGSHERRDVDAAVEDVYFRHFYFSP